MSGPVSLGRDGGTRVVLRDAHRVDQEGWSYFVVELHDEGLEVVTGVATHEVSPLADFIRGIADSWRGWEGGREWTSTEPGLSIVAHHRGGQVEFVFTAVDSHQERWKASLTVLVEPGKELSNFADEVDALLRPL